MNSDRWTPEQIFVYRHPVDMRKQIDGLASLVSSQLHRDPIRPIALSVYQSWK